MGVGETVHVAVADDQLHRIHSTFELIAHWKIKCLHPRHLPNDSKQPNDRETFFKNILTLGPVDSTYQDSNLSPIGKKRKIFQLVEWQKTGEWRGKLI